MSNLAVMVVDRKALVALTNATDETLPDAVRTFRRRSRRIESDASSAYDRQVVEAVFLAAADVIDSQFEMRATHAGNIDLCDAGDPKVLAKSLLPLWNSSHLARLIRQYSGEFLDARTSHPEVA